MRWRSWLYIFAAEALSVALSILAGILSNVLTNEQHPKRSVIVGIIAFGISSAVLQTVRYILAERETRDDHRTLSDIKKTAEAILVHQQEAGIKSDDKSFDDELNRLAPEIHRQWIKLQWRASPSDVTRLMKALYDPTSRPRDIIAEWLAQRPSWFDDLGWHALLVGAELANSYDGTDLAIDLLIAAATNGATRRHYWISRASLLRDFQGNRPAAQRILTEGGVDSDSPDRFAQIIATLIGGDGQRANDLLASWSPQMPIDILLSASIRVALIVSMAAANNTSPNFARIVTIYRETIPAIPFSANPKISLSATLMSMIEAGSSANRHNDLQEALDLAIQARDICRQQQSSSVGAVNLACQAAYEDGQFDRVIDIGTTAPGEANLEESESDIVRYFVASSALLKRRTEISDGLIPLIEDPFRRAFLAAAAAEVAQRPSADLWRDALAHSRDVSERFQALLGLARIGISEPDNLSELSQQQAALINAVSAASSGSADSAIEALRSLENMDLNSAAALAEAYMQIGNVEAAVDVLREASQILDEPRLRIEAAVLLWRENHRDDARAELENFLVTAGSNQNLRQDALALLGQWAADEGKWAAAVGPFQEFLALNPGDGGARWAVILVMLRQGLFTEAVRVYNAAPVEPMIIYPDHARAWMAVKSRDGEVDFVSLVMEVIEVANRFPDNEDVQAEAIFTILAPGDTEKPTLPAPVQSLFHELFDRFFRSWPDSPRLRRFNAGDIQDLVHQMEELVRPNQQQKVLQREVADRLANNTLPWAFLSAMTGRTYSEVVIKRAAGVIPAQHIDATEQSLCLEGVYSAFGKEVVLDVSAGAVLTELADLGNLFIGKFKRLLISENERLDAVRAVEFLRGRSTSSWVYDETSNRGRLVDVPAEVANRNFERAVNLLNLLQRCRAVPVSISSPLSEFKELATSAWASAVECASQNSLAFWCDDVALRAIARSIGVTCFSTPALLEALNIRQEISADQHESGLRALIRALVGDFVPNQSRLSELISEYRDVAAPIASIFGRSAAWANTNISYPIWISLVQQVASFDQKYVADWANAGTVGITRLQPSAEMRRNAAALLLGGAVTVVSSNRDEVARCVFAVRAGLVTTRDQDMDDDPLGRSAKVLRDELAGQVGFANATIYVSRMFAKLDSADHQIVLQALYGS